MKGDVVARASDRTGGRPESGRRRTHRNEAKGAIGERAEAMLPAPGASPTAWTRSLVNDLAIVQTQITVVHDDYHEVTGAASHALVQFLLDHAPASLHPIVCARVDPPIALGSLRAIGRLAEVRTADPRFTDGEAAALLVETEGLNRDARASRVAAVLLRAAGGLQVDREQPERFAGCQRPHRPEVPLVERGDIDRVEAFGKSDK